MCVLDHGGVLLEKADHWWVIYASTFREIDTVMVMLVKKKNFLI